MVIYLTQFWETKDGVLYDMGINVICANHSAHYFIMLSTVKITEIFIMIIIKIIIVLYCKIVPAHMSVSLATHKSWFHITLCGLLAFWSETWEKMRDTHMLLQACVRHHNWGLLSLQQGRKSERRDNKGRKVLKEEGTKVWITVVKLLHWDRRYNQTIFMLLTCIK